MRIPDALRDAIAREGPLARAAIAAFFVAAVIYGGGKGDGGNGGGDGGNPGSGGDRGGVLQIPRPGGTGVVPSATAGATNDVFRWTSFTINGDSFVGTLAWPATNLEDFAAIDIFHKESLTNALWRWIHREDGYDPEYLETSVTFHGNKLPYWEEVVSRNFREITNETVAPFGVTYTNILARVPAATNLVAGFFLAANQHDSDGDGAPDAVETSLGLDHGDPDMDGDGVPDGRELALGAIPLLTDSDGDGLDDGVEVSWGTASTNGAALWIDTSAATNRVVLFTNTDDGCAQLPMPFPLSLVGAAMTNLAINANGLVGFSSGESAFGSGNAGNGGAGSIPLPGDASMTVAAFWDDLRVRPEMDSSVSLAVVGPDGCRTGVVEFTHVGFYHGGTNDFVSFQVQFAEEETNIVRVVFAEAAGLGCGESATLGALSTYDDGVEYAFEDDGYVFPGLAIEYHVGIGTSPTKTDTDDDGLGDAEELTLGTNPHDSDTDCDGLLDKWEIEHPPFSPLDATDGAADADGDGLSNAFEILQSGTDWQEPDTDDDGLDDGEECGYASASPIPLEPFDMTDATDILCQFDDIDEGRLSFPLPFPIQPDGVAVCSNLVVGINGELALATNADNWLPSGPSDERPVVIRAFCDDLLAYTNELGSAMSVEMFGTNGVRCLVVEYLSLGFWNLEPVETNSVSFQVVFAEDEPNKVRVLYFRANPQGSALSARALGSNATLSLGIPAQTFIFSIRAPVVHPGLALQYNIGTGTSPLNDDTDGDGLSDGTEISIGTSPTLPDSDGDGLDDGEEYTIGTNPSSSDTDGDGIPDAWEIQHGVDPLLDDTLLDADEDGLSNAAEYHLGTDMNEPDTDCDGLLDGEEVALDITPLQPDTDGDGMDDGWENEHGFDPTTDNDDTAREDDDYDYDDDEDGLTTGEECAYGTDPTLPDTDNDGVDDATEVARGTDPTDPSDGGAVTNVVRAEFEFGDDSPSESEKYRLEIKPVSGIGATPKTHRFLNQHFDGTDTRVVPLKPGWKYEVGLRHAATDPVYSDYPDDHDYDYRLLMTPLETPTRVILDDPDKLFGRSKNDQDATFTTSPKVAHLYVLKQPKMAADYDRNGDIDSDDEALAASGRALRFWINDDADGDGGNGNYSTSATADIPGSSSPDFYDSSVNGRCDLIDFTPVFIDTECLSILPQGIRGDIEFRLRQNNGAVNAVWSSIGRGDVGSFQTSDTANCGPSINSSPRNAATARATTTGATVPSAFADRLRSSTTHGGVLFIEGRAATSAPLCLDIRYGGKVVATATLSLSLSSAEDMFWWYSLRGAESGGNFTLPQHYTPDNLMTGLCDRTVFFLHGFKVQETHARGWGAEMFKRLWQSGSNARFVAVTWAGDYNWMANWASGLHYHENAYNAFMSADALKSLAEREQPSSGNRILMAHSLGNMVVCEALRKGLHAGKYFMLDAAVPSEAIDGTLQGTTPQDDAYPKYVPSDWLGYTNLSWASNWHTWFSGDSNDARGRMGWPDFFADALCNAVAVYNYYSTGDPVFMETAVVPELTEGVFHWQPLGWTWPPTSLSITFENYSWQKQETRKGVNFAIGTLDGGWGFHIWDANPPNEGVMLTNYTAEAAAEMVSDGSITNHPVFEISGTSMNNPNATEANIREALAKHVPAVSSAIGARSVFETSGRDVNMNSNDEHGIVRPNGWGRNSDVFGQNWLHSDIKEMAYYFIYPFFEDLTTKGNLK